MKKHIVANLRFDKNPETGKLEIVEKSTKKVTDLEMKKRMNIPLAVLTLKRIAVRNSKKVDKSLLNMSEHCPE